MQQQNRQGSGNRWGPLFGAHAEVWADTWEGSRGWGTPVYEHVLERAKIGAGTTVLDCGCGAGRFVRLAGDRGARVAGIDAAGELVEIARRRAPEADLRVGDFEELPWPDGTFHLAVGFSTFQFADDHARALREAKRVSRGPVWVVVPSHLTDSGIPKVFAALMDLFPPKALPSLKHSGMYALSSPGSLEEALTAAGISAVSDDTVEAGSLFPDLDAAVRAFLSAGATALAVQHSGQRAVERALTPAFGPFVDEAARVRLPGWFRVVEAS
jgi:SAM-dependent methyltransferase